MDLNQILSMLSPSQQQSLQGMRGVNAMSPADAAMAVEQRGLGGGGVGIPPELAQMMAQRQTIQQNLPQNLYSGLNPNAPPPELPPEISQMASNGDPTNLRARAFMRGAPAQEGPPPMINPQEEARLRQLVSIMADNTIKNKLDGQVLNAPGLPAQLGEMSRLAAMPGADERVQVPGLRQSLGSGQRGIAGQMASIKQGRANRQATLNANPELAAKMAAREQAAGAEQERRQGIVTDRARLRADRREGITPQMRLLDQMVQGSGQGGGDDFGRNAVLYGANVANDMARNRVLEMQGQAELGIRGREAAVKEKELEATVGALKGKADAEQATADSAAAAVILGGDEVPPGALASIQSPQIKAQVIQSIIKKNGGRIGDALPELDRLGALPEDVQAAYPQGLPTTPITEPDADAPTNWGGAATGDFSVIPNMIGNFFKRGQRKNVDRESKARNDYFARIMAQK